MLALVDLIKEKSVFQPWFALMRHKKSQGLVLTFIFKENQGWKTDFGLGNAFNERQKVQKTTNIFCCIAKT